MKSNNGEQKSSNKKDFDEKYFLNSENEQKQSQSEKQVKTQKTDEKLFQKSPTSCGNRSFSEFR